jgi:hypothetical protein
MEKAKSMVADIEREVPAERYSGAAEGEPVRESLGLNGTNHLQIVVERSGPNGPSGSLMGNERRIEKSVTPEMVQVGLRVYDVSERLPAREDCVAPKSRRGRKRRGIDQNDTVRRSDEAVVTDVEVEIDILGYPFHTSPQNLR